MYRILLKLFIHKYHMICFIRYKRTHSLPCCHRNSCVFWVDLCTRGVVSASAIFTNSQPHFIEFPLITYGNLRHAANHTHTANTFIATKSSKPTSSSSCATASSKFATKHCTRNHWPRCQHRLGQPHGFIRTIALRFTCDTTPTSQPQRRRPPPTTPLHRCNTLVRPLPRRQRPRRAPHRLLHPHRLLRTGATLTRSLAMSHQAARHCSAAATRSVPSMCPLISSAMRTPNGPSRLGVS